MLACKGDYINLPTERKFKTSADCRTLNPYEPSCEKNRSSGFPTRSDTNWAVQPQKRARGLKFRI